MLALALLLSVLCACQATTGYHPAMSSDRVAMAEASQRPVNQSAPNATAPTKAEDSPAFQPQIVYTALLGLQADDVASAQHRIAQATADLGGYVGESSNGRIVARVPSDRFDEAMKRFEAMGNMTRKEVTAQDVTDRVVDLESRLRNGQAMRDRLIDMIERAEDMEAALKIEQELHRVMEQIELIEGRLRLARQQVAYATITITLTRTPDEQRLKPEIPIAWVRDLGDVLDRRDEIDVTTPTRLRDGVRVELPESFIRVHQMNYVTQAIDSEGVRIRVRRQQNFDEGRLAFWSALVARSLRENSGLTMTPRSEVTLYDDHAGTLVGGTKRIGGHEVRYLIALAVSDDYIYTFEAWGEAEAFDRSAESINASIATMRIR